MKFSFVATVAVAGLLAGCGVKPDLIGPDEMSAFLERNATNFVANQEPVHGPIGLYEAMARALKYNLDFKVEMMNEALAARSIDVKSAALLPQLVAASGYDGRDPNGYSHSTSLKSGKVSKDASVSTEAETMQADVTASWNILDFGLSYVRAKQAANEQLIAVERRRKTVNRIVEDVRTAYWRAASAERLLAGMQSLESRVNSALVNSRSLMREGSLAPLTALTYQRELVDIRKQIHQLQLELNTARIQLAALMNLPPGSPYKLVVPIRGSAQLSLNMNDRQLVDKAMRNRPELHEALLKERISAEEADASLLQLLPGIQVFGGANWDSNDLLVHSDWMTWGAKASWNLLRVFQLPQIKKENEARSDVSREQALAMTMAVFTQVRAAHARFHQNEKILKDAADYYSVQQKIFNQVSKSAETDAASDQSVIREEMNLLVSSVKYDIAYADLQNAFASVYSSIGVDPYGASVDGSEPVSVLARSLRSTWIERGDKSGS